MFSTTSVDCTYAEIFSTSLDIKFCSENVARGGKIAITEMIRLKLSKKKIQVLLGMLATQSCFDNILQFYTFSLHFYILQFFEYI